jgi:general secretion pathway protein D
VAGVILAVGLVSIVGRAVAQQSPAPQSAPQAQPQPDPQPKTDAPPVEVVRKDHEILIKLNFQDTPLQTVLEYLSETAGLTIVSDEPVADSRMTVISRQPITLEQAVALINSMLKEKNLTTVLTGKTLKVVTLANAKKENLPVRTGRDPNAVVASDSVVTYVVPVSHVTAVALAENLKALLPEYASLEANQDGNALIITDTTANIKRLMQIVAALDTHMATIAEIRVFRLVSADATTTATLINSVFQQQTQGTNNRGQGGRSGGNPFQMMMQMGGPGGGRNGQQSDNQQGGGNVNVQVVAAADAQTNSVVVRGPVESLDLVANVIKVLDDTGAKVADVRVFQLRYADAMNTADVINQLFGQNQSSSRSGTGRGGRGSFGGGPMMFQGPFGQQQGNQEGTGSAVQVTAAADSRANTVVVTGPEAILTVVEDVVKKLDQPQSNVADVKVFHLQYADASNTAQLINEVFGQSRTSSSSRSARSSTMQNQQIQFGVGGRGGFGGGGGQQQTGQTTSGSDIAVVASGDTRTNSVVVSGPPETLKVIEQIIKELDSNPEQERRIFVYSLKNGTATSLMTILNSLFQQMQTLNQRATGSRTTQAGGQRNAGAGMASAGGGAGGGAATTGSGSTSSSSSNDNSLSEETYFEADPNTNSLLVMTSTKNYEKIKPIIKELDKPVGQVLIKVLFAELTHTNDTDWGSEFSMLNLRNGGNGTQTIGTLGRPLDATTPGGTLGAGATGSGGLSVRTLQGDLDITLHALQDTGKLNVLSRPYVLTRNNRLAKITVADEVPIPTGTTTVAGQTQITFDYRKDIGIVLNVTPSINEDGLVNMIVSPTITTDTKQVVDLGQGLEPHIFSTRSASTRVAVKDGQTIVIGGLIQDQTSETVRKVPLLGDIPIAGNLFKRTQKSTAKIELLIFLTPYVAAEPKDLAPISKTEEQRSSLSKDKEAAEVYKRHMDAMKNEIVEPNEP